MASSARSAPSVVPGAEGAGVRVRFGADRAAVDLVGDRVEVALPLPVLAGPAVEDVLSVASGGGSVRVVEWGGHPVVFDADAGRVAGAVAVAVIGGGDAAAATLEEATQAVYAGILRGAGAEWHLYRTWNYVPRINESCGRLENYRAFNLGRWRAFTEFGDPQATERGRLPAASAVGHEAPVLVVVFAAGREPASPLENPVQVPAYRYPSAYGPKPPCFSRGLRVGSGGPVHLSGTASIRGHRTVGAGDLRRQLETTADNIERMLAVLGAAEAESWKCYLRHAADLEAVRTFLGARFGDSFRRGATLLRADICRSELLVEVEGSFAAKPRPGGRGAAGGGATEAGRPTVAIEGDGQVVGR